MIVSGAEPVADFAQLASMAEAIGWQTALFEYTKARIKNGQLPYEDSRSADWMYLLSADEGSVSLVFGCGLGEVPIALSRLCGRVYALDSCCDKLAFLNARKKQQQIDNLFPVCLGKNSDLSFPKESFDIVSVREFGWLADSLRSFPAVMRYLRGLLKNGGQLHLNVGNRVIQWRSWWKGMGGYTKMLQEEGFSNIEFYAPLPYSGRTPLFYVPLNNVGLLDFSLRDIFRLFEAASPEVKKAYAFEYRLARLGVKIVPALGFTRFLKYFVPGFHIFARKNPGDFSYQSCCPN